MNVTSNTGEEEILYTGGEIVTDANCHPVEAK